MFITYAFAAALAAGPTFAAPAPEPAYPTISYGQGSSVEAADWPTAEAGGTLVVEPGTSIHFTFSPPSTASVWEPPGGSREPGRCTEMQTRWRSLAFPRGRSWQSRRTFSVNSALTQLSSGAVGEMEYRIACPGRVISGTVVYDDGTAVRFVPLRGGLTPMGALKALLLQEGGTLRNPTGHKTLVARNVEGIRHMDKEAECEALADKWAANRFGVYDGPHFRPHKKLAPGEWMEYRTNSDDPVYWVQPGRWSGECEIWALRRVLVVDAEPVRFRLEDQPRKLRTFAADP